MDQPLSSPNRIEIHGIAFTAPCGVFPEERAKGMAYHADITLYFDLEKAAHTDALEDTVDYAAVTHAVVETAKKERFLVEKLAGDIADRLLSGFPLDAVTVAVTKEAPPVQQIENGITVTLHRTVG